MPIFFLTTYVEYGSIGSIELLTYFTAVCI